MKDLVHQLLEAHIEHELNRFKDERYKETLEEEVSAAFEWIEKIRLKDVVTPEQVLGIIRRNVVELPVADGIMDVSRDMSGKVLASSWNKKTALDDIVLRKQFDEIVQKAVSLKKVRKDLIQRFVNSSAYAQQISEVLFTGIKEYMLTENFVARKVPGISSLIKAGTFAVSKTMPSLEAAIESRVKEYIESNLEKTITRSERSLNEYFDTNQFNDSGEEIWESIAETPLSEHFSAIDAKDLEDFITIGSDFWLHFRKTPYFKGIYTELVKYFFKKYGDRTLDVILEDFGVTREMVILELTENLSCGIGKALSTGYLEARIRARLESFYFSEKAASLVSEKKASPGKPGKKKVSKPVVSDLN